VPARPYRPRDKAKVEVGVQVVERWIIAALRHQKFFRLEEVNRLFWRAHLKDARVYAEFHSPRTIKIWSWGGYYRAGVFGFAWLRQRFHFSVSSFRSVQLFKSN